MMTAGEAGSIASSADIALMHKRREEMIRRGEDPGEWEFEWSERMKLMVCRCDCEGNSEEKRGEEGEGEEFLWDGERG